MRLKFGRFISYETYKFSSLHAMEDYLLHDSGLDEESARRFIEHETSHWTTAVALGYIPEWIKLKEIRTPIFDYIMISIRPAINTPAKDIIEIARAPGEDMSSRDKLTALLCTDVRDLFRRKRK